MQTRSPARAANDNMEPRQQMAAHWSAGIDGVRADAMAVEQSVEMPLAAIDDAFVRDEIVGRVEEINQQDPELFEVRISLSAATVENDPGQLINMLFGNSSLQEDVLLHDVLLP